MRRPIIVTAIVALRFAACGGETTDGQDATAKDVSPPDAIDDVAAPDVSTHDGATVTDAQSEKQWPIVYDIVDGGGDSPSCYPDGNILQACCNGQDCRGFCVLDDDGAVECNCFGIPGGCVGEDIDHVPNVCCSTIRGCETESYCNVQK